MQIHSRGATRTSTNSAAPCSLPSPSQPDWEPALAWTHAQDGRSLAELARGTAVLVVFLRHFG